MTILLEVALVATYQPCEAVETKDSAHCLGIGSAVETGAGEGA